MFKQRLKLCNKSCKIINNHVINHKQLKFEIYYPFAKIFEQVM